MITQEQGWSEFEQSRRKTLTVGEQLKQYRYIQNQFDRFEGKKTPPDLEGAPARKVTMVSFSCTYICYHTDNLMDYRPR
jgi:hypothetical protein